MCVMRTAPARGGFPPVPLCGRMKRMQLKPIVILYHADCPDGFGAAWAVWRKLKNKASYIPVKHNAPPPAGLVNREIFIVDFCYRAAELKKLEAQNKKLVILDHHVSNKEDVKTVTNLVFDLNHSGSVLAWRYFHPGKKLPRLLAHVEDVDMWKFRLADSMALIPIVEIYSMDFEKWNKLSRELESAATRKKLLEKGRAIVEYRDARIRRAVKNAFPVLFKGHRTLAINSSIFHSELGNLMAEKLMPPIAIIWREDGKYRRFSLRSNGKADVAKLAQQFGGGGHHNAAAFQLPLSAGYPWKRLEK